MVGRSYEETISLLLKALKSAEVSALHKLCRFALHQLCRFALYKLYRFALYNCYHFALYKALKSAEMCGRGELGDIGWG